MTAKKIRALIGYEGITQAELANLYGQLSRDNFSERELEEIAKACNAKLQICFITEDGVKF